MGDLLFGKFSATSHGKGVVDGVGGKVKSTVRRKVMCQGKNCLIVQDCESFVAAAKQLICSTKIIHIDEQEILAYKDSNPFEGAIEVRGIIMKVDGENTSLWRNCALQTNSKPDIVLNKGADMEIENVTINETNVQDLRTEQDTLVGIHYNDVTIGMWVITIYEDEKWLGKVVDKKEKQICVRCLEKPFGVKEPQNLEREENAVYFDRVFRTDAVPILTQYDANGKKGRKWFWHSKVNYISAISISSKMLFY